MAGFKHHKYFTSERYRQLYLFPHACLKCRKAFKKPVSEEARRCPQCGGELIRLSRKFSAPQVFDTKGWEIVSFLVAQGIHFYSAYESRPPGHSIRYPKTMDEAKRFAALVSQGEIRAF